VINLESRIGNDKDGNEKVMEGYFLSEYDLARLVRDFQADCHDGFVSNDLSYIEHWLKKHDRI